MSNFPSLYKSHIDHLKAGYEQAMADAGVDTLVIESGVQRAKHPRDDQDWPFWSEPMFLHWLPLREPGTHLILRPGKTPELLRAKHDSFWEGPHPLPDAYIFGQFDVKEISADKIKAALPSGARVAILGPDTTPPQALIDALSQLRARKTDYERACIAEANRLGSRGHNVVFSAFRAENLSELELNLRFLQGSDQDTTDAPYNNIVALNENAGILHHIHYGRKPSGADASLLVDAGGMFNGYCSDITRTEVKGKSAAAEQFRTLIAEMDALQRQVITLIKPGMNYEELHDASHVLLAGVLNKVGLCKASDAELVDGGVTRAFFPHGLGHSLGIQVHDVGCKPRPGGPRNPFLRHTATITVGQVFTIEPGCYFIPSLLDKLRSEPAGKGVDWGAVERLSPLGGIRIEDNIFVLDKGTVNLTRENWA